jgi:hypothetical protein
MMLGDHGNIHNFRVVKKDLKDHMNSFEQRFMPPANDGSATIAADYEGDSRGGNSPSTAESFTSNGLKISGDEALLRRIMRDELQKLLIATTQQANIISRSEDPAIGFSTFDSTTS